LEQNISHAWSLVFLPSKLLVLLKIIFFISLKTIKNHFENSNLWGMWPLGHVGHVTYKFVNMLFISTGIFVYNSMISSAHKFCR